MASGGATRRPSRGSIAYRLPLGARLALFAAGIVLLCVASALFVTMLRDDVYGARIDILYQASDTTPGDSRDRILATQRELILSRTVLAGVADSSGRSLAGLRDAVSVEVGRDDLLRVVVEDGRPETARTTAQAVATRYLEVASRLSPESERGQALIQRQIDGLQEGGDPLSAEQAAQLAGLRAALIELQVGAASRPRPELVSQAYVLDDPLGPSPPRAIAFGLLLGLLLATAVIVLGLRFGRR